MGSKKGKEGEGRVVRGVRRVRMGGQGRERSKKGKEGEGRVVRGVRRVRRGGQGSAVSYTHLTLPTRR